MRNFAGQLALISCCLNWVTSSKNLSKTSSERVVFEDDMYANLLMRAVSGSLYPFDTRLPHIVDNAFPLQPYDFEKRKYGLDWPIIGHTMIGWVRLQNIYNALRICEIENVTGDFVEAGETGKIVLPAQRAACSATLLPPSHRAARRSVERRRLHFRSGHYQEPRL